MLVAWLTFKATSANLRYTLVVADVNSQLKEFAESCSSLASDIEKHLLGKYEGGFTASAAKESRKQIMGRIKTIDGRRMVLSVFLRRKKALELKEQFDSWQRTSLGESFPATRKDELCKEYDKPITELQKALTGFECYLADLRRMCIDDGTRFQKILR
jgi:hypothetical protein